MRAAVLWLGSHFKEVDLGGSHGEDAPWERDIRELEFSESVVRIQGKIKGSSCEMRTWLVEVRKSKAATWLNRSEPGVILYQR